ncbi:MAG: hypothetical protein IT372_19455 [Polyangiaceae bacterium]|nr:hypothetical protein [Polyangiaceae bacterium]
MVGHKTRAARTPACWVALAGALFALGGCNVPEPPGSTGGTTTPGGECGRGVTVSSTDFQSANISFVGVDGAVLSSSVISSATTSPELSAPLSGDVAFPTLPQRSDRIVLLDRYMVSALTWVDVKSGAASSQLSVATGFTANPQDYVEVSPTKAYVSRLDPNPDAGAEPFDGGSDVLIIDPSQPAIADRIDLMAAMDGEDPAHLPRPNRMVMADRRLYVLLSGYSIDFSSAAESRLVTIDMDTDTIADVAVLDGMRGCGGLALSPSGDRLAVGCSGLFGSGSMLAESGVVVLSRGEPLAEERRWTAADFGESPLGLSIAFATEDDLVFTTMGSFGADGAPATDDRVLAMSIETGEFDVLLQSDQTPFSIGEVQCVAECAACFVADAEAQGGVVHRFEVDAGGALVNPTQIVVDTEIGLPPRYLGRF